MCCSDADHENRLYYETLKLNEDRKNANAQLA